MATTYTRNNAWNKGGNLTNLDLLWYAKGVGKMMSRALNDPASWWFYAAIHGEYVTPANIQPAFPGWKFIKAPPTVPTSPLPVSGNQNLYWNQCQHQSWFFLPWHRGYLMALEAQLRKDIVGLGGPATWALPYWNYFGGTNGSQYQMPPAFAAKKLPDNNPNPLFVNMRYGPDGNGNIYLPTPAGEAAHPGDPNFSRGQVNANYMSNDLYTGHDQVTKLPGFGGPETLFHHGGGTSGNWEGNPHNLVHVYVGYYGAVTAPLYGLMSDPGIAGLDPIFYLHHANIDRMWAEWNANPANTNPTDPNWLNGPAAIGEREFVMPMPNASSLVYTPQQVNSLSQLNYTYDSLQQAAAPAPPSGLSVQVEMAQRLTRLGTTGAAIKVKEGAPVTTGTNMELVGASQGAVPIKGVGATAAVKLNADVRRKVSASLAMASESAPPDRVFLNLENVRGTHDATVLSVYINLPEGAKPGDHPELLAGSVGLFGLRRASLKDGQHGGQGLDFVLEITKIIDALHLDHALDADALQVRIVSHQPVPDQAEITVGRISVYRQGQ